MFLLLPGVLHWPDIASAWLSVIPYLVLVHPSALRMAAVQTDHCRLLGAAAAVGMKSVVDTPAVAVDAPAGFDVSIVVDDRNMQNVAGV